MEAAALADTAASAAADVAASPAGLALPLLGGAALGAAGAAAALSGGKKAAEEAAAAAVAEAKAAAEDAAREQRRQADRLRGEATAAAEREKGLQAQLSRASQVGRTSGWLRGQQHCSAAGMQGQRPASDLCRSLRKLPLSPLRKQEAAEAQRRAQQLEGELAAARRAREEAAAAEASQREAAAAAAARAAEAEARAAEQGADIAAYKTQLKEASGRGGGRLIGGWAKPRADGGAPVCALPCVALKPARPPQRSSSPAAPCAPGPPPTALRPLPLPPPPLPPPPHAPSAGLGGGGAGRQGGQVWAHGAGGAQVQGGRLPRSGGVAVGWASHRGEGLCVRSARSSSSRWGRQLGGAAGRRRQSE